MTKTNIHIGDAGLDIVVKFVSGNIPFDVSSSTSNKILFKKPSGAVIERNALIFTDGTDGRIRYTTIDNDIDELGVWQIWGETVLPAGKRTSDRGYFAVIG